MHVCSFRRCCTLAFSIFTVAVITSIVGCGNGSVTALNGTVTHKGQPVKGGRLVFSPVATGNEKNPGVPAVAEIKEDGTFTAPAGALLGKNRVVFTPPEQVLTEAQRKDPKYNAPPPAYMGFTPKQPEVEVKAGTPMEIELVKK